MADQALAGLKVLDFTHCIAGPFCTKLLADYGADVIKVEMPGRGDTARRMGPFPDDNPDPEKSGLFLYLNTNKKGVTLNLKTKSAIDLFTKLVSRSDVLVENFRPGVLSRLGLDYRALKKINPKLVVTSISNFGQTGPYRDWKATELTLSALSGTMYKMGDPEREPVKYALNVYQYLAGKIASAVTLAAVMRSDMTGIGEHIDLSILETVIADVNNRIATYSYSRDIGSRAVAKNYVDYPFGGFPAKDGYVAIQGLGRGEEWMPRLFEMIGHAELKEDPEYSTRQGRASHLDEFNAMLYSWLSDHTKQEIFDEAARVRYPAGPVYDTAELVNNPHYRGLGFFVPVDHPAAGKWEYPGPPFRISEGGYEIRMPAPLLGQHNAEILCGLAGYSETDLGVLRMRGVI